MAPIKVPEYVSSQGVPGSAPYQLASPEVFALSETTAERELNTLEAQVLKAIREQGAINAEIAKDQRARDVLSGIFSFQEKLDQADNDIKTGRTSPDGSVVEAPATSQDYYQRWLDAAGRLKQATLA